MKKLSTILSVILAVQLGLAAILFSVRDDSGAYHSEQALLELTKDGFDGISLEQKDKPSLTLKKDKDGWLLPDYFNVPVDTVKLDDFSRRLLELKTGWTVASSEEASERFQVNKDKFERKIVFQKAGKPVKTLYLGTSPGFKKSHARVEGNNEIQVIEFAAFEANVAPEDWMKQDLLKLDPSQLSQIKAKNFSLGKTGNNWILDGIPAGQTTNTTETRMFVDKLLGLNYSSILGVTDKPEYHLTPPALSYTVKRQSEEIIFDFGKADGLTDDYVLKVSNLPYYFKMSKSQVEALSGTYTNKFVMTKPATPSPATGEGAKPEQNDKTPSPASSP